MRFEGVSFAYPDGREALRAVDLTLRPGEHVALVGENGAGKSTLVKLLLRLYDPSAGRITVGGVDLRELDLEAWRARIGAVPQAFGRYWLSVGENIGLGDPSALGDAARLRAAARDAGVPLEEIGGLEQPLGQPFGGTELSGGQWQRLALARALLRGGDLLLLDEPSAALDPRAEAELFERFERLAAGRTALLITHRLGSVRGADRVVVLEGGRVVEEGDHLGLLALGGAYAELWRLQADRYAAE